MNNNECKETDFMAFSDGFLFIIMSNTIEYCFFDPSCDPSLNQKT